MANEMKRMRIYVAIAAACLLLCGCQKAAVRTVYNGEDLRVEQRGREMTIYDLTTGKSYTLVSRRVRKKTQEPGPRTLIETDSIKISVQGSTTTIRSATGVFLTISKGKIRR